MDTTTLLLATLTAAMAATIWHAWRLGNEKRDLALLGVVGALCGMGTAIAAVV